MTPVYYPIKVTETLLLESKPVKNYGTLALKITDQLALNILEASNIYKNLAWTLTQSPTAGLFEACYSDNNRTCCILGFVDQEGFGNICSIVWQCGIKKAAYTATSLLLNS